MIVNSFYPNHAIFRDEIDCKSRLLAVCFSLNACSYEAKVWDTRQEETGMRRDWDETGCGTHQKQPYLDDTTIMRSFSLGKHARRTVTEKTEYKESTVNQSN